MKLTHFAAYFIAQTLITIGMALAFQLYAKEVISVGMVALAVVFAVYSVGEAITVMYPYLGDEPQEEEDDGGESRVG